MGCVRSLALLWQLLEQWGNSSYEAVLDVGYASMVRGRKRL
jgi:hypothetical protein